MDFPTIRDFRAEAEANPDEAERRISLVYDHRDVYEPLQEAHPGLATDEYFDERWKILAETYLARGDAQKAREIATQVVNPALKGELLQQITGRLRGAKGNGSNGKATK